MVESKNRADSSSKEAGGNIVLCIDARGGLRNEVRDVAAVLRTMICVPLLRKGKSYEKGNSAPYYGDLLYQTGPEELKVNELYWPARGEAIFVCTDQHSQGVDWSSLFSLPQVLHRITWQAQHLMLQSVIVPMQYDFERRFEQQQLLRLAAWTAMHVRALTEV